VSLRRLLFSPEEATQASQLQEKTYALRSARAEAQRLFRQKRRLGRIFEVF
jgi:hypothetical protein